MRKKRLSPHEQQRLAEVVACLSSFVHSSITGDFQTAAKFQAELRDAGFYVRVSDPSAWAAGLSAAAVGRQEAW